MCRSRACVLGVLVVCTSVLVAQAAVDETLSAARDLSGVSVSAKAPAGSMAVQNESTVHSTSAINPLAKVTAKRRASTTLSPVTILTNPFARPGMVLDHSGVRGVPANDDCTGAVSISTFPSTVSGTTIGATDDCPDFFGSGWNAVWYAIDLPYAFNEVQITICGVGEDLFETASVLVSDCDCPPAAYWFDPAGVFPNDPCASTGYQGFEASVVQVPGPGTVYIPLLANNEAREGMDFELTIDVIEQVECDVVCVGTAEGEPTCADEYEDTYNNGCPDGNFTTITCGDTICGESGTFDVAGEGRRDTDWYQVVVTEETTFTFTVTAEFNVVAGLVESDSPGSGDCADTTGYISPADTAAPCEPAEITVQLPAGTHWFFVSVDSGDVTCGAEYEATLTCAGPCDIECPVGADDEAGFDPDCGQTDPDPDGGCNADEANPPTFPITVGTPICGTGYTNTSTRDTDWFSLAITEPTTLTMTLQAEFNAVFGLIETCGNPDCAIASAINPALTVAPCETDPEASTITTDCLPAGTYWIFVGSTFDLPVDCGKEYVLTVDAATGCTVATGACCVGFEGECVADLTQCECEVIQGGTYQGDDSVCDPNPCEICADCPAGSVEEGEPDCGLPDDTVNRGCNADPGTPPLFSSATCGDIFCGSCAAADGTRDTDWIEIVLTEDQTVTFEVQARFDSLIGIVNNCGIPAGETPDVGGCAAIEFAPSDFLVADTFDTCATGSVSACLKAGTYWLFVAQSNFDDLACESDYTATITCEPCDPEVGACCLPDGTCVDNTVECECELPRPDFGLGGTWQGAGTICAEVECPLCEVDCPAGAMVEAEVCGETTNDGCNMEVPAFETLATLPGDAATVCGTMWANGGVRDTDWYIVETTEPLILTLDLRGEYGGLNVLGGFVETDPPGSGDCDDGTGYVNPFAFGGACEDVQAVTGCVPPGTYWAWTSALPREGLFCEDDFNDYVLTVSGTPCVGGACCATNGMCEAKTGAECATENGIFLGDGVPCGGDCNENGIADGCDIASGTSPDCNLNGVPDECDIDAGTSTDCQPDGTPDDCQLLTDPAQMLYDDGSSESGIGIRDAFGELVWLAPYQVSGGRNLVTGITVSWSFATTEGDATTLCLWEDPDDDGDPTNAVLLETIETTVQDPGTDTFFTLSWAEKHNVGSDGDWFFVGVINQMNGPDEWAVGTYDTNNPTPTPGMAWADFVTGGGTIDPSDLSGAVEVGPFVGVGNWLVRAEVAVDNDEDGDLCPDDCPEGCVGAELIEAYSVGAHGSSGGFPGGEIEFPIDLTDGLMESREQRVGEVYFRLVFDKPASAGDFSVSVAPPQGGTATLSAGASANELELSFSSTFATGDYTVTLTQAARTGGSFRICYSQGDVNCSGNTTGLDLAAMQSPLNWNKDLSSPGSNPRADINRDGQVTALDSAKAQSPQYWNLPVVPLGCTCIE